MAYTAPRGVRPANETRLLKEGGSLRRNLDRLRDDTGFYFTQKHKGIGDALGGILETAAPLAAFIPGVGPVAAGALAAGGSIGGQALQGEPVNFGRAALTGLGTYGASQLASGGVGAVGGKELAGLSKVAGPGGGGGNILGRVGGSILDFIKADPERAIKLGLGGIGAFQASRAAGRADDLQRRALAPLYGGGVNPYDDLPVDSGNPYAGAYRRPTGQRSLAATLSR